MSLTSRKYERAHTFPLWHTSPSGSQWKHVEIPIYVISPFRVSRIGKIFIIRAKSCDLAIDVFLFFSSFSRLSSMIPTMTTWHRWTSSRFTINPAPTQLLVPTMFQLHLPDSVQKTINLRSIFIRIFITLCTE